MSQFGDVFTDVAVPKLLEINGDEATYTDVSAGTSKTVDVAFVEFVGAVDEIQRALFLVANSGTRGITAPERGDTLLIDSVTWTIIDIRSDLAGEWELRCDSPEGVA